MRYFTNSKWQGLIAIILICLSGTSFAVGFGKIKVYSYLNEFLSAEIELIGVENVHPDLLIANLASSKDFIRANMARPFFLTKLSFEIIRHEDQTVIYISSIKPVKNPFLEFLVELSWPDGKLVKGYTILIDPSSTRNTLSNRPKSLKSKKELIADNTKFSSPESIGLTDAAVDVNKNVTAQKKHTELQSKELVVTEQEVTTEKTPSIISGTVAGANSKTIATTANEQLKGKENSAAQNSATTSNVLQSKVLHEPNNISSSANTYNDITKPEEILITDNFDMEGALDDNIAVNKPEQPTGLLSGIITAFKKNPVFTTSSIDSKKLAENTADASKAISTEQPPKNIATLKDLLTNNAKTATVEANSNGSNKFAEPNRDRNISVNQTTELTKVQSNANKKTKNTNQTKNIKHVVQLVLSFVMVLISGIFILKIWRQANANLEHSDKDSGITTYTKFTSKPTAAELLGEDGFSSNNEPLDELAEADKIIASIKEQTIFSENEKNTADYKSELSNINNIELTSSDNKTINVAANNFISTLDAVEISPDDFEISIPSQYDEKDAINLKITLAKQYIDAGDNSSAKSILEEIINIVEPSKKPEISDLLKTLDLNKE